jgi:hypothetical protein
MCRINGRIEKEEGFPTLALSRSGQGFKGFTFISADGISTPSTKVENFTEIF